jgi:hypothetical protein
MTYQKGTDHLKDLGIDRRRILKLILKKYDGRMWTKLNWLKMGSVVRCFRHGNVRVGSMKGREFMDELDYCQLLKEDSAPCGVS